MSGKFHCCVIGINAQNLSCDLQMLMKTENGSGYLRYFKNDRDDLFACSLNVSWYPSKRNKRLSMHGSVVVNKSYGNKMLFLLLLSLHTSFKEGNKG